MKAITERLIIVGLNPNVRITGMQGVKVGSSAPGRFAIGPYIGFGYDGSGWKPSIGVSLQYSLIRF